MSVNATGLTNWQRRLLALVYRTPGHAATPEQIRAWGFNLRTVGSLQLRGLLRWNYRAGQYEVDPFNCRAWDAAFAAARWAAQHYPECAA